MCRLFGFRSVISSQVHRSLVAADNALCGQSSDHPDGWGVAYYVDGAPHLTKSSATALHDQIFHRVSGVVSSETVVAHIRKATQGELSVLNCHPFQYGKWVFAHNGDIPAFAETRAALVAEVHPRLRRFILGDTDSEVVFFLILTALMREASLASKFSVDDVMDAIEATIKLVREISDRPDAPSLLTFILTDGVTLAATRGGKELFLSTYKTRCADRDVCPSLSAECEGPSATGKVNHFILSSRPLSGDNVWRELSDGDLIGVDWRMNVVERHIGRKRLTLVVPRGSVRPRLQGVPDDE